MSRIVNRYLLAQFGAIEDSLSGESSIALATHKTFHTSAKSEYSRHRREDQARRFAKILIDDDRGGCVLFSIKVT